MNIKEIFIGFILVVLIGAIWYGGCKLDEYKHKIKTITLQNGQIIQCHTVLRNPCGGLFYDCLNGQTYDCQTNYSIRNDE